MGTTHGHWVEGDYIRVCDLCGVRRNISAMRRTAEGSFICDYHQEFKTAFELDASNRSVRVPLEQPVPYPKPQDPYNPYTFIDEEGQLLTFVAQMVTAGARYLNVTSGVGAPVAGEQIGTLGWAGYYLYGLIAEGKRPEAMLTRAETLLAALAVTLQTRQVGFGLSPSATRASTSAYGAFLESGGTQYLTEDAIVGGLALLYAYRVTGTFAFLVGARAAASYLRNVQSIGKYGVNHTSTDSAGTGYLYTGSLCSEVSTAAGMYSNHLFYPSALMALVLWKELTTTDGDQQIGATTAIAGDFSQIPQQFMSTSMTDLRACWTSGIADSTNTTINGLSATTPREYFNAYPATKANATVTGTGMWEYADGPAALGTQITSANWAKAMHALYVYESASTAVTTLDAWLRAFASNDSFETPANTSPGVLARSMTGEYDAAKGIATVLTIRDSASSFAATATNGSDLYDWGAFGLLGAIRAAQANSSFAAGRRMAVTVTQRWKDGKPTDGEHYDRVYVVGKSGLSIQTAFAEETPPDLGLILWLKADRGVEFDSSGNVLTWIDQTGRGYDVSQVTAGTAPSVSANAIGGRTALNFSTGTKRLYRAPQLTDRDSAPLNQNKSRSVFIVAQPVGSAFGVIGGPLVQFGYPNTSHFTCPLTTDTGLTYEVMYYSFQSGFYSIQAYPPIDYRSVPVITEHRYTGYAGAGGGAAVGTLRFAVNGVEKGSGTVLDGDRGVNPGGVIIGGEGTIGVPGWCGLISEILVYDYDLTGTDALREVRSYLNGEYSVGPPPPQVNDAVRSAQLGLSFRQQPIANRMPGT